MLRLATAWLAARAKGALWLLLLAYVALAAMLLHDDAGSAWTWALILGGGFVIVLFVGILWFWLAIFKGLGDRNG
ncbi:MAG: hypothetical protein B7Z40_08875 [Bosea sp. 12-68-7]|nr:MAG: hypothetical protein B7Z40_08875 [Bosea sp. 12-68-7]OYW99317.1 MAG: hypothetical protein B7Z14_12255 [Bosea sp. 32-68-6]